MGVQLAIRMGGVLPVLVFALLATSPGLAALPPDVQADLHLVKAERQIGEGDYEGAVVTLGKILELQREHGFEIPAPFWFKRALVFLKGEDLDQAEQSAVRYIETAGREGEHYVEALELLDQIEQARSVEAEEAAKREAERKAAEAEEEARKREEEVRRQAEEAKREAERKAAEEAVRRMVPGTTFQEPLRSGGEGPQMVILPSGIFRMGCLPGDDGCNNDEKPAHYVRIPRPFAVSVTEITFADYDHYTNFIDEDEKESATNGYLDQLSRFFNLVINVSWAFDDEIARLSEPATNVSWEDAKRYVAWLSEQTGAEYRLLSESEWEYAARAGSTTKYNWGDEIGHNRANCNGCGSRWDGMEATSAWSFEPNAFGLYNMHGNVWEWVEDCWNDSYQGAPTDGSAWETGDCERRVGRGGSWSDLPESLRSARRGKAASDDRVYILGFRVARTLTP